MNIECRINDGNLHKVTSSALSSALHIVGQQALSDCNFYCKEDTKNLVRSSISHSDLTLNDDGEIVLKWVTPYAEFQYNFPGTRTDKNPNACPRWCEVAENNHKSEWEQTLIDALRRGGLG